MSKYIYIILLCLFIVLTVNEASTLSTLVDILLAYAYDVRTTLGERYFKKIIK